MILELYYRSDDGRLGKLPSDLIDPHHKIPGHIRDSIDLTYKIQGKDGLTPQEEVREIISGKRTLTGVPIDEPPMPMSDPNYWAGTSFEHPSWKKQRMENVKHKRRRRGPDE